MSSNKNELSQHLSLFGGTILILNIVLGAGLLILPGLVFEEVGTIAIISWMACAAVSFPILLVMIFLGLHHPSSGGVSHYAKLAFGEWAQLVTSLLFLGAIALGLPSIALTGGYYVSELSESSFFSPYFIAFVIILFSSILVVFKVENLKLVLNYGGSLIIVFLSVFVIFSLFLLFDLKEYNTPAFDRNYDLKHIFSPFMMIFFAFTGWEIASHLTEEFRHPKTDYPIAMILSFILILLLYLLSAFLVQELNLKANHKSPFIEMGYILYGEASLMVISLFAFVLVFSNLFSAIWGVSRQVYYLSRESYLPRVFSVITNGVPIFSVMLTSALLLVVLVMSYFEVFDIKAMLRVAGQNFFLIYGIASASLFVLGTTLIEKLVATVCLLSIIIVIAMYSVNLYYPLAIVSLSSIICFLKRQSSDNEIHRVQ